MKTYFLPKTLHLQNSTDPDKVGWFAHPVSDTAPPIEAEFSPELEKSIRKLAKLLARRAMETLGTMEQNKEL